MFQTEKERGSYIDKIAKNGSDFYPCHAGSDEAFC